MKMEALIEEVRTRPVIWDTTLEIHRDAALKDKGWDEIAEALTKDKTDLKNKWKKLKDCHRQALQRRKTSTGQAASKIKKWKYEDEMKFLLATMIHRPSDTNIPPAEENDDQQSNHEEHQEMLTVDIEDGNEVPDEPQTIENDDARKERRNRSPRGIDKVLAFMQAKEKNKNSRTKNVPDELDLFFASAAQSVRKLPRRLQNKIKIDLLTNIARAEEENEFTSSNFQVPQRSFVSYPSPTASISNPLISPSSSENTIHPSTSNSPIYDNSVYLLNI